jgi:hypothetical protein
VKPITRWRASTKISAAEILRGGGLPELTLGLEWRARSRRPRQGDNQEAIRFDPTNITARRNLANIFMESGRLAEARFHGSVLLQLNYCAGQDEAAISKLNESRIAELNWQATALNWPEPAVAYYRLGNADEAMH